MFEEQRRSDRKLVRVRARVHMEGVAAVSGRTGDLGANGVSVHLVDPVLVGQTGIVAFDLLVEGRQTTISTRARAMYCIFSGGEFKVGFQFLNLELPAMTVLARFLR